MEKLQSNLQGSEQSTKSFSSYTICKLRAPQDYPQFLYSLEKGIELTEMTLSYSVLRDNDTD